MPDPVRLGNPAPDFAQDSTLGPLRFHEWLAQRWAVVFAPPVESFGAAHGGADAGPCTIEFARRKVQLIAVAPGGTTVQAPHLNYPIILDTDRTVSALYGFGRPERDPDVRHRTLFVIDAGTRVRLIMRHPVGSGREFRDVIRVVDVLQRNVGIQAA